MSTKWKRQMTQVVVEDVRAWVEQLYSEHRVRLEATVTLPTDGDGIKPGVRLEAFRVRVDGSREAVHSDWVIIRPNVTGEIEGAVLKMASRLLLDLENDRYREEAKQASLWTL